MALDAATMRAANTVFLSLSRAGQTYALD